LNEKGHQRQPIALRRAARCPLKNLKGSWMPFEKRAEGHALSNVALRTRKGKLLPSKGHPGAKGTPVGKTTTRRVSPPYVREARIAFCGLFCIAKKFCGLF